MTTLSIRVPDDVAEELQNLSDSTGRTRSFLALEALGRYLDQERWQVGAIRQAVDQADSGNASYASHQEVDQWLASWGKENEQDAPECK